ncbi:transcription factor domain-containing protein [Aspergillus homomorphus CBS 101889]|uniref:Fungal-specific transcription factor domain protein n=1 Tax=Aspergillus homomorphus (strain CBS 101889) TaxID=1450537 RepID=A0A395HZ34_ASPHC|nr:fungal-specific transcription factor domain protein [Aspergillus homomorphus CBS 101889]RAL12643.1 fungal-specific transcription factor domain protein [Aspergillus homomorphus CBS 101889]
MRLSISCDSCRRSKVKCVHDGQPPCRRCQRLNREPCLLTDPRSPSVIRTPRARQSVPYTRNTVRRPSQEDVLSPGLSPGILTPPSTPVAALTTATLINACDIYRKRFPVVNFLHYPSLIADLSSDVTSVDPVFLAALLSLCVRFMSDADLASEETYAGYARSQLAHRAFEAPSLYLAQSLVMLSLYEWGSGHPYRAWMYSGMATYMIQTLLKTADDSMEHNPEEFHAAQTQIAYEQLVRTYWCCFAQDCELSSGARQHIALSFRQILVPLPISDQDFTFGRVCATRLMPSDMTQGSARAKGLTIDCGLSIVTRGFDIFVRILRFANESRRGRGVATANAQGVSSRMWATLKAELDEWRELQDLTVRFPDTSAQAHVALGYGELFAYINLVYFMSILFLYRDSFLSTPTPTPRPAHIPDPDTALDHLFTAAQHIGSILAALDASGTPVITSYAGYSVFVAAHINMYGTVVPARYPGGRARAEHEKKRNFEYLERLCRYWVVGHSWWRTLQEANRFYSTAKPPASLSNAGSERTVDIMAERPDHLTLAGTLDEYGDIRVSRPEIASAAARTRGVESSDGRQAGGPVAAGGIVADAPAPGAVEHGEQLGSEMVQWPFLDENWSLGFDLGFDAAWPGLG